MSKKDLTKTLQNVVDRIRVQLFLYVIAIAIIVALVGLASLNIAIIIAVLGYGGMVGYVFLEVEKVRSTQPSSPVVPTSSGQQQSQIGKSATTEEEICYYSKNDSDPMSNKRLEILKILADEASKSEKVKILINTGEPIFATKTSFLNKAVASKAPGLVKVLLLDPQAKSIIKYRAQEIGYTEKDYKDEIATSINFCKINKIDCKLFNFLSPWRLFIFDDERAYVQFYLPKKSGDASPIYGYKIEPFSIGASFLQYFENTYATSSAVP
ncbi:hypothetical protein MUO79_03765 [Candidatus Bathyarchaeota archaeon]|nr:hypothetical protein [Candidatus Bathyarchaeota archaeon]